MLLIADADNGKIVGQVRIGPMAGVAFDPKTDKVFTGNSLERSLSEVDPVTLKELRSVDLPGPIDAIAYDQSNDHIYADEDDRPPNSIPWKRLAQHCPLQSKQDC